MAETGEHGTSNDTIFAPATGPGRTAVAIVRLSGPGAHDAIRRLAGGALPPWRALSLRTIRDATGEVIDQAMVAVFPEGASYTGEAMAEIQCHGGPAVLADLFGCLGTLAGFRLAEPGEFTRRAMLAGRMDLSEVEGLADLVAAETSAQRRQALRVHSGAVSRRAAAWRAPLLRARALLELVIDFADDEIPDEVAPEVCALLDTAIVGMGEELARAGSAERLRAGFEVAVIGPPNAGKSSLINAIAGRDVAIVTEVPGTTRDVLEVRCDLGGLPVTFLDTAGLREAHDRVEAIGVERARQRAGTADLRLVLRAADAAVSEDSVIAREGDIRVWAKSDLGPGEGDIVISVARDEGVRALLEEVERRLAPRAGGAGVLGTLRQRRAVEAAHGHLVRCRATVEVPEMAAEELRLATEALDRLVGRIGVEDVLGEIFAGFCLGK